MRKSFKGHLAMLVANSIWGFTTPMAKIVLSVGSVTFLSLTSVRLLGAAVVFWIASIFTKREKVNARDLFLILMASIFGIVFAQGAFMKGLSMTSPIDASIMTTTTPIFTLIISAIYLKEEITSLKIGGILLGAFGAILLIISGKQHIDSGSVIGNCLCMLAQLSFSIYLVMFKGLIDRFSPVTLMKWIFTFAFLCWIPFSYNAVINVNYPALSYKIYFYLGAIIFGGTFFSYLLISVGQHSLRPSVVGMYNYIQPVVASGVAVFWGMDTFDLIKFIAVFLVFTGVYLVNKGKLKIYPAYSE
jgi:drug/metabolite transporter (DMT)-like permease